MNKVNNSTFIEKSKLYLSRKEAAFSLSITTKTVDRWIRIGIIKAFKLEGRVLIAVDSLTPENLQSTKPIYQNKF